MTSNLDIAVSLYEQGICGQCAVPSVCRKFLLLKIELELLHVRQGSKPSNNKVQHQIEPSLFKELDTDNSKNFEMNVNS